MINRVLIRLKTVQVVFSHYLNEGQKKNAAELELALSLDSAYDLYQTLLNIPVLLLRTARRSVARQQRMLLEHISRKETSIAESTFLDQLESNETLAAFAEKNDLSWLESSGFIKDLYQQVLDSDLLEEYMQEESFGYDREKELVRKLYKQFIENNDTLDELLEEQNIYWNGDKMLIDSFVLKTIKSFRQENGASQQLQPQFRDPEDRTFAMNLLKKAIATEELRKEMVAQNCRRWDPERLAFIDVIIIQVALAEILSFDNIPVKVSINEYVEMAKSLSTPSSGSFVNGMLDTIVKQLRSDGRLNKEI